MFPSSFAAANNLDLYCWHVPAARPPARAVVIAVHGLGDHSEALPYRNLSEALSAFGFAVYSFDLPGHGRSPGRRVHINDWSEFRHSLAAFVRLVEVAAPGLPCFLVGLSLGGLIALDYAISDSVHVQGVVAVAPAVDAGGVPPLLRRLLPLIARVAPKLELDLGLDRSRISRDAAALQAYTSDPYWQTKTTARLAVEVMKTIDATVAQAALLKVPLLILHGGADTIVPASGSAAFFEAVGSEDKERRVIEGAYHNLFIELNRDRIFGGICSWINRICDRNRRRPQPLPVAQRLGGFPNIVSYRLP